MSRLALKQGHFNTILTSTQDCSTRSDSARLAWRDEKRNQFCGSERRLGRPPVRLEIRTLIRTLAQANPLWRAPRIHGELQKLGIEVSERTVSRVLRSVKRPPSQTWRTFLRNHTGEIVAVDFFTVPTIRLRLLFVFLVIEHQRRKVLHCGVTEHPTSEWTAQQIVAAFSERDSKHYLVRDRDSVYGHEVRRRIQSLGIREVVTAPRSPWQNAFPERLIGSIQRDCLDYVLVLGQRHLRRLMKNYLNYYHRSRTHLALAKDTPEPRAIMRRGESGGQDGHAEPVSHRSQAQATFPGLASRGRSYQP